MKKIYSLLAAVLIASATFAQVPNNSIQGTKAFPTNKTITTSKAFDFTTLKAANKTSSTAKTTSGNAGWFNYGTAIKDLTAASSVLNANYLFPDSMGFGDFGGTPGSIWIHHLAEMIDFKSVVFSAAPTTSWVAANPTAALKIDSMSIVYAYTRNHPSPNIVDTLIVTVYDNQTAANLSTSGFASTTTPVNYGTDTVSFKRIGYNQAGNFIAAPTATTSPQVAPVGKYIFKVLLTIADTSTAFFNEKVFSLPVPFSTLASKLTIGSVMFKPGYTYTLGQNVDATANTFLFTSYEENGASSFPTYFDCNFASAACDYSQSFILPQDVRYNIGASWNYRFLPSLAYTAPYGYEHHLISFHVTDDMSVGVKENTQNTFGLTQNMPNPFSKESVVNYNLVKDASSAVFTVTDVMGRVVSSEKVATTTGTHTVKLGAYAAGIYYYSLNVDGNVTTKKMIAQ